MGVHFRAAISFYSNIEFHCLKGIEVMEIRHYLNGYAFCITSQWDIFWQFHLSRFIAALMQARWLKACGVLPICSPELFTSSENIPTWFANSRTLSKYEKALLRISLSCGYWFKFAFDIEAWVSILLVDDLCYSRMQYDSHVPWPRPARKWPWQKHLHDYQSLLNGLLVPFLWCEIIKAKENTIMG